MVVHNKEIIFSCDGDTEENRQLIFTSEKIIITYGKKRFFYSLEFASIDFEEHDELYRITAKMDEVNSEFV